MKKNYEPKGIEKKIYDNWEFSGFFTAVPDEKKEPFCIMIPPPNVTGTLHMGHGFNNAIMDALTRYHRMQGHTLRRCSRPLLLLIHAHPLRHPGK